MATRIKEIESLRARILKLEELQENEEKEKQALEDTQQQILKVLEDSGISFESFIRFNYKTVRRIVTKIEKEQSTAPQIEAKTVKRKAAAKRRKKTTKVKPMIKIPAGKYSNVPGAPDTVFEVKEKGPRPKVLKSYAEEVGLEIFFKQCRVE
ncbi:MAG: hypothetical protein ABFS39_04060 [Pseudomonadota bacterium]